MINYSLAAFQEPRGVMRLCQFVSNKKFFFIFFLKINSIFFYFFPQLFAICAFATTVNFDATVSTKCGSEKVSEFTFSYPFDINEGICKTSDNKTHQILVDVASDAQFFVATGVLSLMYCIFIIAVYAFVDDFYKSKSEIPLADFALTVILAIFWLSGSAAWANGTSALKSTIDVNAIGKICTNCTIVAGAFTKLNISLIFGFLNFFLWAAGLWFLYKETIFFQGRQTGTADQSWPNA